MFIIECGITCHTKCQHFIPDFCGLSMEMANQMLSEIKAANKRKTLDGTSTSSKPNRLSKHDDESSTLADHMSQMSVNTQKPLPNPHLIHQQQKQQQQQQQHIPQPSSPVGRVQPSLPPVVPPHNQPYQPQQYPIQSNDPRYQPQQHQLQQQFDPFQQQQPYHSPNMLPIYNQPSPHQPQLEVVNRVSIKKIALVTR